MTSDLQNDINLVSYSQKDSMRQFLGVLVGHALGWEHVESVTTRLELSHRFENNGWDGRVRIRFLDGREYARIFTSYELEYTRVPGNLIEALHRKIDLALSKAAQA